MVRLLRRKRGIIRILEAVTAILLIIGVMLFLSGRQQTSGGAELTDELSPLLDEMARNVTLRLSVLSRDPDVAEEAIRAFLDSRLINPSFGFAVRVCDLAVACGLLEHPEGVRDVFVAERVISSTLRHYQPKRVKLFVWEQRV